MGQIVFCAEDAEAWHAQGKSTILVFPQLTLYLLIMVMAMLTLYGIFIYMNYPLFIFFFLVPVNGGRKVFLNKICLLKSHQPLVDMIMSVFQLLDVD